MNLANFDKNLGSGPVNFSSVMEVEARIFTTPTSKKDYSNHKNLAAQKANSATRAAENSNQQT